MVDGFKLTETLDSIGSKNIFAPNDAAFTKLADSDFERLTDAEKVTIIKKLISEFFIHSFSWLLTLFKNQSQVEQGRFENKSTSI